MNACFFSVSAFWNSGTLYGLISEGQLKETEETKRSSLKKKKRLVLGRQNHDVFKGWTDKMETSSRKFSNETLKIFTMIFFVAWRANAQNNESITIIVLLTQKLNAVWWELKSLQPRSLWHCNCLKAGGRVLRYSPLLTTLELIRISRTEKCLLNH